MRESSTQITRKPFWRIAWPVVLAGVLIVGGVSLFGLLSLEEPGQVSIVGDILIICFALCPLALCGFVLYMVLAVAAFGIGRVERGTRKQLRKAQRATSQFAQTAQEKSHDLNKKSIDLGSRFAGFDHVFDTQKESDTDDEQPTSG
jgi:hypothetical protein